MPGKWNPARRRLLRDVKSVVYKHINTKLVLRIFSDSVPSHKLPPSHVGLRIKFVGMPSLPMWLIHDIRAELEAMGHTCMYIRYNPIRGTFPELSGSLAGMRFAFMTPDVS